MEESLQHGLEPCCYWSRVARVDVGIVSQGLVLGFCSLRKINGSE